MPAGASLDVSPNIPPAWVARVAIRDFRSYMEGVVSAGPGPVVVTGENGAGKTNLLEAISLLSPGRGLRGVALSELARTGGPGHWAVAATVESGGAVEIGTGTTATAAERRQVRVNGAAAAVASLAEWLSVLWLTPAMDRLFVEGTTGRRRFLDRLTLALHPGHAGQAARYDAAMRARNRLLAEERQADPAWLTALERQMADHGAAVAEARRDTVAALAEALALAPAGPFARARVRVDGWAEDALEAGGTGDVADALADELRRRRAQDAAAGRATLGPHRTDLLVVHADKEMPAERCSTGEQKALLLGLVLAHAGLVGVRRGKAPVLLLDEVAAHLDAGRREALFDRLAGTGAQVWMTGTDRSLFAGLDGAATFVSVAQGALAVEG
jgi:DNA replication and repair protein RecF